MNKLKVTHTAAYLKLMQTFVETLKHQSVKQVQEADTWEILPFQRLFLDGGKAPRGRRDPRHPSGAGWGNRAMQQPAVVSPCKSSQQPCNHDEGETASTQSSKRQAEQGGATSH